MPPPANAPLLMYQIEFMPLDGSRHTSSNVPSALKSPVPATTYDGLATDGRARPPMSAPPFMNQIDIWPVLLLRHSTSARPSWLKSPTPLNTYAVFAAGGVSPPLNPDPLTYQR